MVECCWGYNLAETGIKYSNTVIRYTYVLLVKLDNVSLHPLGTASSSTTVTQM